MTPRISMHYTRDYTCSKCEGNMGEAVEQEVKSCDKVETVREFTNLGERVSEGGGCETVVAARTRYGWVKIRVCDVLLYGRRFPLRLEGSVYESYVRPAMLCGSETQRLKESEIGILQWTVRSMVRAMC